MEYSDQPLTDLCLQLFPRLMQPWHGPLHAPPLCLLWIRSSPPSMLLISMTSLCPYAGHALCHCYYMHALTT